MKNLAATIAAVALVLAGCASRQPRAPASYAPVPAPVTLGNDPASGTIYPAGRELALFSDVKARRVGDTVTIRLAERTQASKSASTDAAKDTSTDTGSPTLFGGTPSYNGHDILTNKWETSQDFKGKGNSSQSNSLDGNITVTVAEVYPNGNLYVRGEKWLTLNQGEEFVQVSGIVRPVDIGSDNSVASYKVADARITYSGRGTLADANRPGILSRFFMKLWPL